MTFLSDRWRIALERLPAIFPLKLDNDHGAHHDYHHEWNYGFLQQHAASRQ